MEIFYSDTFELPLPEKHRFPMSKYRLLRERIAGAEEFRDATLRIPNGATNLELQRVHDADYVQRVVDGRLSPLEIKRIGFPWSPELVERSRRSVGASIEAASSAISQGVSVNLAGGTHHAFADAGQGYCVFNDVMVAARAMQIETDIRNVLVVDLDVHQGNGTAAIARPDPSMFSFSMHCDKNYPFRKDVSDLDVALPPGTEDEEYLQALRASLEWIEQRFEADLVFYLGGADPYAGDRLGHLRLTKSGLQKRDEIVMEHCRRLQIPLAIAMSGGYAPDVNDIVDIHFATVRAAWHHYQSLHVTGRDNSGN